MALIDNFKQIELPKKGTCKFILVELYDSKKTKIVLIGDPKKTYHNEIYKHYLSKIPTCFKVIILGGGKISINDSTIHAYGKSYTYGIAPQELVEKILNMYVEENRLNQKVRVDMGHNC